MDYSSHLTGRGTLAWDAQGGRVGVLPLLPRRQCLERRLPRQEARTARTWALKTCHIRAKFRGDGSEKRPSRTAFFLPQPANV